MMRELLPIVALTACGMDRAIPAEPPHALGMTDVSILLPLPADPSVPTLATIDGVVPENLEASLVGANNIGPKSGEPVAYGDFHIVAVRFDLCERASAGDCPDGVDGRLRLVLQPLVVKPDGVQAHDIALHAFFPIPAADLPGVVTELRALAALQDSPAGAPLGVATGNADYLARLRALVLTYAHADALVKLTVIGQDAESGAFAWRFGGFELLGEAYVPIAIPALTDKYSQHLLDAGDDTVYHVEPGVDSPPGFALTLVGQTFTAATPDDQRFALNALAAIQNPMKHDAPELQCVTCHVATFLTLHRSATIGLDPTTLEDRYVSPYNTAIDSIVGTDSRAVRGFGWAAAQPAISQRVANDTAHVLTEIEKRFPPTASR